MSNPTRPSAYPTWTQGNNSARQQPTNGEQLTGFTANFRPPSGWHNWLFGIMSDWVAWLDFVTSSAANFVVSNVGHNVATSTTLQGQLDQLDAVLSSLGLIWCTPTGTVNGVNTNFELPQAPININSAVPFVDGVAAQPAEFSIQQISGQWYVVFNAGFIPTTGQAVTAALITGSSGVGVGGGVGAIDNEPGGVGLYYGNNVNVALLKSLVAGTNVTITDNGNGTVSISATGGGGGGSIETHGSAASPIAIDPTVGIQPTTAETQVWWITPISGSGAVPITAAQVIKTSGMTVGQRLILKTAAAANYLVIPAGTGTDQNGPCSMGTYSQTISYTFDGVNWSEDSRRV